jgi:MinD-like ATPase involved in chromosome partitioning or flagellar assembly
MSTTPTGPGRRSADPWADAGPAPSRPRPGSGPEADLLWSTRQDLRRTLNEAQDDPATGFESVADRVQRDYSRRPALSLGARGWRAVGNLFRHDTTPARLAAYASEAQSPVTTGRRIAVVSLRGGAGKTTVSAMMARTFATLRPEPVAAVDLDPGLGSLGLRLGHQPAPGADSTAQALAASEPASFDSVASLLAAGPDDLYCTGPRMSGGPLGEAGTTTLLSALSRYFPVTVLDCPTGPSRPDTAAVLARSHAAVFVVPATAAGVDEARGFLGHWLTDPYLAAIPVIAAVVATDRSGILDPLAQAAALTRVGVDAVALRHDRHLAGGVGIGMHLTRPENRLAATELCARILTAATTHGAHPAPAGGAR